MNKKTLLLFLAFALSITLGTYVWFKPSQETLISHSIQDVKIVANNLNQLKTNHQNKLEQLQANNDFLIQKIQQTKAQVQTAKNKVGYLRKEVQKLNQKQTLQTEIDTSQFVMRCDSLQTILDDYFYANAFTDSIINEQFMQYEDFLFSKDSTINCLENDYKVLQTTCDTLLKMQLNVVKENKQINKKLARTKRVNRFFKGSILVVAGVIIATQIDGSP